MNNRFLLLSFLLLLGCVEPVRDEVADKVIDEIHPGLRKDRPLKKVAREITNPEEQFKLASEYLKKGLGRHVKEIVHLNTLAAEQGHRGAQSFLGHFYHLDAAKTLQFKNDLKLAIKWYTLAAQQGDADALFALGQIYNQGGVGVLKDQGKSKEMFAQSASIYLQQAKAGDVDSQFAMGKIYERGQGVERDLVESVKWFESAAFLGHVDSQVKTHQSYLNGKGVPRNQITSYAWCEVARFYGRGIVNFAKIGLSEEDITKAQELSKQLLSKIEAGKPN